MSLIQKQGQQKDDGVPKFCKLYQIRFNKDNLRIFHNFRMLGYTTQKISNTSKLTDPRKSSFEKNKQL